ncbi:MAG: D-alanyl-D-alanine carboxypeptidase/D-alanyl-D-alanine-endopeptidase [Persicimonas sp.]
MHRFRSTVFCLTLAAFSLIAAPVAAQEGATASAQPAEAAVEAADAEKAFAKEAAELDSAVRAILAGSDVTRGTVGIHVEDVDTGQVLVSRSADEPMNPASNVKLITSAAALDTFGPQHSFGTRLMAEGVDDAGTVEGSLYVEGGGEAFLLFEDFLDWAGQLRQKGVTAIEGDIVIDDTAFDGDYLPPGFEQKDEDASYRPPIGAVSVNFNAVSAVVEPGDKPGAAANCRLVPPNKHVEIVNKAKTAPGRRRHIQLRSEPTESGTRLVIEGRIGQQASAFRGRKRIDNPPEFAGAVLASALEMVGIEFDGEVKVGSTPDDAEKLVSHSSQPLSYVVLAMNKWSNNFMAEQVLRNLGVGDDDEASTWDASREAAMEFLEKAGVDTEKLTIHNGSGLYDGNLVSPRQFVQLLRYMNDHPSAPEYLSSLAIAGTDGTLKRRLKDAPTAGNVRAKTGTLNEVSAVSGYARTESGRMVAFSVLVNDPPRRAWHYRPVQDRIVEAIVGFDG